MFKKINIPILVVFLIVALFFARSVQTSSDAYWHMAIGRQIWQTHQIPTVDNFIYSSQNTHFTSTEWLYGLIIFIFYRLFGPFGIIALRVILIISICNLVYKTLSLFTKNVIVKSSLLLAVTYSLAYRFYDRPENFSYLFISLLMYLIFFFHINHKHSKLVYSMPLIFLIWPNIHAFTLIGLYLLTIYLFLEREINLKKFTKFLALYLICILISILEYKKITYALGAGTVSSVNNGEFMSIWERIRLSEGYQTINQISLHIYLYFFGLFTLPIAVFMNLKKRIIFKNLFITIFFVPLILIPIKYFRLVPLGTLFLAPIILHQIQHAKKIKYIFAVILCLLLPAFIYSIIVGRITLSREYISLLKFYPNDGQTKIVGAQNLFWKESFPQSSVAFTQKYLDSKRIFTHQYWGNYYLWYLPNVQVFRDVLGELQYDKTYAQADIISYGGEGWEKLLLDYNIDTVVNSQDYTFFTNSTPVYKLSNWKLVYISDSVSVWARTEIIKNQTPNLSAIHPELTTDSKFKKEDIKKAEEQLMNLSQLDQKNIFAIQQLIEIKIENGQLDEAITQANEARIKFPNDPIFDLQLAKIYAQINNCRQAKIYTDEAAQRSFNNPSIKIKLKTILSNCL